MEHIFEFKFDGDESKNSQLRFDSAPKLDVGDIVSVNGDECKIQSIMLNLTSGKYECCCKVVKEHKPEEVAAETPPKKRRAKAKAK